MLTIDVNKSACMGAHILLSYSGKRYSKIIYSPLTISLSFLATGGLPVYQRKDLHHAQSCRYRLLYWQLWLGRIITFTPFTLCSTWPIYEKITKIFPYDICWEKKIGTQQNSGDSMPVSNNIIHRINRWFFSYAPWKWRQIWSYENTYRQGIAPYFYLCYGVGSIDGICWSNSMPWRRLPRAGLTHYCWSTLCWELLCLP